MLSKILPLLFLLAGTGAGIGAGLVLAPSDGGDHAAGSAHGEAAADDHGGSDAGSHDTGHDAGNSHEAADSHGSDVGHGSGGSHDYIKLTNQFVVPIVDRNRVTSMVVLSLSLEVKSGYEERIYSMEPKLRDGFLQVLFDHANMGGFSGAFTNAEMLSVLRNALRDVARRDLGDLVSNVLIVDIARQDI